MNEILKIKESIGLDLTAAELVAIKEIVLDPYIVKAYMRERELETQRDHYKSATERVRGIASLDPDNSPQGGHASSCWACYARGVNEGLRCARTALDEKDDDD